MCWPRALTASSMFSASGLSLFLKALIRSLKALRSLEGTGSAPPCYELRNLARRKRYNRRCPLAPSTYRRLPFLELPKQDDDKGDVTEFH